MTKIWTATAVAAALATAGTGSAEPGGPTFAPPAQEMTVPGGPEASGPTTEDVYGTHPAIRKLFFWKKSTPVTSLPSHKHQPLGPYGPQGGPLVPNHAPAGAGVPAAGVPGTLVFPVNPYVRSPRDYFMYEPGGR